MLYTCFNKIVRLASTETVFIKLPKTSEAARPVARFTKCKHAEEIIVKNRTGEVG